MSRDHREGRWAIAGTSWLEAPDADAPPQWSTRSPLNGPLHAAAAQILEGDAPVLGRVRCDRCRRIVATVYDSPNGAVLQWRHLVPAKNGSGETHDIGGEVFIERGALPSVPDRQPVNDVWSPPGQARCRRHGLVELDLGQLASLAVRWRKRPGEMTVRCGSTTFE